MNVALEIERHAAEGDKAALRWLFSRYHRESQWHFVASCEHRRYGVLSYETNRVWSPTIEGRALYKELGHG